MLTLALMVQKKCEWNCYHQTIHLFYCILHPKHSERGKKSASLKPVLSEVLKITDFIKACSLNIRLFNSLCDKTESPHIALLLPAQAPRPSWGKTLVQLLELQTDPAIFYMECPMTDTLWLFSLGYLADILKSEWSEPVIFRKRTDNIFCQW